MKKSLFQSGALLLLLALMSVTTAKAALVAHEITFTPTSLSGTPFGLTGLELIPVRFVIDKSVLQADGIVDLPSFSLIDPIVIGDATFSNADLETTPGGRVINGELVEVFFLFQFVDPVEGQRRLETRFFPSFEWVGTDFNPVPPSEFVFGTYAITTSTPPLAQVPRSRIVDLECILGNVFVFCDGFAGEFSGALTIHRFELGANDNRSGFIPNDDLPHPYIELNVGLPCRNERNGGVFFGPRQVYALYITLIQSRITKRIISFNTNCDSFFNHVQTRLPVIGDPNLWFTEDLLVKVVLEFDDGADSATPIVLQSTGQLVPVFDYVNDFGSSVGFASLFGDAVRDSGSIRLTDSSNERLGSLVIDDLVPGGAVSSFVATFDLQTGPGSDPPADGISFNLSQLPNFAFGEEGAFGGLTISFDTFDNPGPDAIAIDMLVNFALISRNFTNPFTNGVFVPVSVVFDADGTLDLTFDGAAIFTNLPTGYTPATGDRFGFGGRTGGFNEENRIDNVSISIVVVPQ